MLIVNPNGIIFNGESDGSLKFKGQIKHNVQQIAAVEAIKEK
jgi:hypothetical protein